MRSQPLYLGAILNTPISDASGPLLGRLWDRDLTVSPDEEFPVVSQLLFRRNGGIYSVVWDRVALFNPAAIFRIPISRRVGQHRETCGEIRV